MDKDRLSKRTVEAIPFPKEGNTVVMDTVISGFGVRVNAGRADSEGKRTGGRRTYFMYYRVAGVEHRPKIGVHGVITADEARSIALGWAKSIHDGKDPNETTKPKGVRTIRELCERYIKERLPTYKMVDGKPVFERERGKCKPGVALASWNLIHNHVIPLFGDDDIELLPVERIVDWRDTFIRKGTSAFGKPVTYGYGAADKAVAFMRALYNLAGSKSRQGRTALCWTERNPADAVAFVNGSKKRKFPWTPAQQAATTKELTELMELASTGGTRIERGRKVEPIRRQHAYVVADRIPAWQTIAVFWFLIYTGVRKSQGMNLRWDQINGGNIAWDYDGNEGSGHKEDEDGDNVYTVAVSEPVARLLSWCRKMQKHDGKVTPWVFPNADGTGPICEIDGVWNRLRVRLGLFDRKGLPARIHDLRHMVGDTGAAAGLTRIESKLVLNHKSDAANERYAAGDDAVRHGATVRMAAVMEQRMPLPAFVR